MVDKAGFLQWEKDGVIISNDTNILDPALTTYSIVGDSAQGTYNLQILLAQESDEGVYRCVVTAAGFSEQITSNTAVLSISSKCCKKHMLPNILMSNITKYLAKLSRLNVSLR